MQHTLRLIRVILLIALLVVIAAGSSVGLAQTGTTGTTNETVDSERITGQPPVFADNLYDPSAATGTVTLLVELNAKPTAVIYAEQLNAGASATAANDAVQGAIAGITAQQEHVSVRLAAMGGQEVYRVHRVFNGIVVRVDASKVNQIRALAGVKSVTYAPIDSIDNSTSVPFIEANTVWDSTGTLSSLGLTGASGGNNGGAVQIAVIDTGIDYMHANFDGSMNYTGSNQTTINETAGAAFPTAKVVRGYDFAGDNYDANGDLGPLTPTPDPDPMDCNGHGSHVAGSAAGVGVDGGVSYTGTYDNLNDAAVNAFDIGPGSAPEAQLVALKVFGCQGSTDLTLQAIDYAMDGMTQDDNLSDHFDVINMSLGSNYGYPGYATIINNATTLGIVVVTSSGNAGDITYITGTPGSSTEAISTANISDVGVTGNGVIVDPDGAGPTGTTTYFALRQTWPGQPSGYGVLPVPAAGFMRPTGTVSNTNCTTTGLLADNWCTPVVLGCDETNFTGFTPGKIALIDRGSCAIKLKAYHAQVAGASAVVVISGVGQAPNAAGDDVLLPAVTIPTYMVSNPVGQTIIGVIGTATGQLTESGPALPDRMAGSSSRGPRRANLGNGSVYLKPDVAAPGTNITSTLTCYDGVGCTGNEPLTISGTSMASPHVAGLVALMRELHPSWSVAQIKALVMNTANHNIAETNLNDGTAGAVYGPQRAGAGRVDAVMAAADDVIAYNTANPIAVSLTFEGDVVNNPGSVTDSQSVTVQNNEAFSVTYNLSVMTLTDTTGVAFSVTPASITVPAMSTGTFTVTVTYTPTAMTHVRDVNTAAAQTGTTSLTALTRHWISEEGALAILTPTAGASTPLRVPLYAAPRPASDMDSPALINTGAFTGTVNVPLTGVGLNQGSGVTLYRSKVQAFNLLYSDVDDDLGAAYEPWDGGDIQYVGATSDVVFGNSCGGPCTSSFIGISMHGDWDTPRMREVYVCVDLDQDGAGGAFADGTDFCYLARTDPSSDNHVVWLWDINGYVGPAGAMSLWDYQSLLTGATGVGENRLFDQNTLVMAIDTAPAAWPGETLTGGAGDSAQAFDFYLMTQDLNDLDILNGVGNELTDATPTLTFNPTTALINHATGTSEGFRIDPFISDQNGANFAVLYNLAADPDGHGSVLMLHHHNMSGDRADVVVVNAPPSVPTLVSPANMATGVANQAVLDWNDSTNNPSGYQVQVDNNSDFSSPNVDTTVVASTYTTPPMAGGTYYWRVRSMDIDGAMSAWSTVRSFQTLATSSIGEPGVVGTSSCAAMKATVNLKIRYLVNGRAYTMTMEAQDSPTNTLSTNKVYMTRQTTITFGQPNGTQINFKWILFPVNQIPGLIVTPETYAGSWANLPATPDTTDLIMTLVDKVTLIQTQTVMRFNCTTGAVTIVSETVGPITNPIYYVP